MIIVQVVSNTELNQSKQQHKPLTEQQKEHNKEEAQNTLFQIVLEYIMNGGQQNASN